MTQPVYTERRKAYMVDYYARNREKILARRKEYRAANGEKLKAEKKLVPQVVRAAYQRRAKLKSYGLTESGYDSLLISQGGVCALCGGKCVTGKPLAVDHDHKTGKVRGLLCLRCNVGIGQYEKFNTPQVRRYLVGGVRAGVDVSVRQD